MHVRTGLFVGAMPPERFLEDFMTPLEAHPPTPSADFSKVPLRNLVPEMCKALVQAVEKSKGCPGIRLFRTRNKKRRDTEVTKTSEYNEFSEIHDVAEESTKSKFDYGHFPALAARMRPRPRRGAKKTVDILESYDYSTALLDIEVQHNREADPFTDPYDDEASNASSQLSDTPTTQKHSASLAQMRLSDAQASPDTPLEPKTSPSRRSILSLDIAGPSRLSPQCETVPRPRISTPRQKPESPAPKAEYYQLFENPSPESTAFRKSLISHAAEQFTRRHRVHLLQLVIFNRWARFIRWDRSGAVSTERFDYVTHPHLLSGFFWRFAHLTDEQRGLDPTVVVAKIREKQLLKGALEEFVKDMKAGHRNGAPMRTLPNAEQLAKDLEGWPVWKIHITDATEKTSTEVVVGRPLSDSCHVFGRATRAYIAYDLTEQRLVFLKDTWRMDHPNLLVESQTYSDLKKHNVPHIPHVLYGGDVQPTDRPLQETSTQAYAVVEDEWRVTDYPYDRYIHHRLVQDIAYPLESALDVNEFLQVLHDVLLAISEAHTKAGLLHRDLSIGNVMIDNNGRGVLSDWDHAGYKDKPARGIGTWRFMSVPLLSNPRRLHTIADDLEGLYWVLLFGSMKLFASPGQDIPLHIFDWQNTDENGRRIGGELKHNWVQSATRLKKFRFDSTILHKFLCDSRLVWLRYYYAVEDDLSDPENEDSRARAVEALARASSPSFWLDRYAAVLQSMDKTRPQTSKTHVHGANSTSPPGFGSRPRRAPAPAPAPAPASNRDIAPIKSPMRDLSNDSPSPSSGKKRPAEADAKYDAPLTRSKKRKLAL